MRQTTLTTIRWTVCAIGLEGLGLRLVIYFETFTPERSVSVACSS